MNGAAPAMIPDNINGQYMKVEYTSELLNRFYNVITFESTEKEKNKVLSEIVDLLDML